MLDGSWLKAQGSWLMAKGGQGRPGEARGFVAGFLARVIRPTAFAFGLTTLPPPHSAYSEYSEYSEHSESSEYSESNAPSTPNTPGKYWCHLKHIRITKSAFCKYSKTMGPKKGMIDGSLMLDGSWLMAHGSWLMAHGSRLKAPGSWPREARGGQGRPGDLLLDFLPV